MYKSIKLSIFLGTLLSSAYSADTPYSTYDQDCQSQVISPNQQQGLLDYEPVDKIQVMFQSGVDHLSSLNQASGFVTIDSPEESRSQITLALRYPADLPRDINLQKMAYKSSCAIIADGFLSYVEYPFYTDTTYAWAKGISLTQSAKMADYNGISVLTFLIANDVTMMIAMGSTLPIISNDFIKLAGESLAATDSVSTEIFLPLFSLSTQQLTPRAADTTTLYSAFISTKYSIPATASYERITPVRCGSVIDRPFSFGLYNPHTRRFYLQGVINSVMDIETIPSSYLDYVPGYSWLTSALKFTGLS